MFLVYTLIFYLQFENVVDAAFSLFKTVINIFNLAKNRNKLH